MATRKDQNSEMTEQEWSASDEWIRSADNPRTLEDHAWATWGWRPWHPLKSVRDRKEMLLMVALCRQLEPLLIYPEGRELLRVAESFADDPALAGEMSRADKVVYKLLDRPHPGTEHERHALELVGDLRCKPSDAVLGIDGLAGFLHARNCGDEGDEDYQEAGREAALLHMVHLIRCLYGNPFRPVAFNPGWLTGTAVGLARQMYESRDFHAMPILADALQEAGCDSEDILAHCRGPGPHARGCWVVDWALGEG